MSTVGSPLYAAILGFGTVGQGIYNILEQRKAHLTRLLGGRALVIVKVLVTDARRQDRKLPAGFDAPALLTDKFEEVVAAIPRGERLDVVFEATVGVEPATTWLTELLQKGLCRAVVTANKVMYARSGAALQALAREKAEEAVAAWEEAAAAKKALRWKELPVPHFIGFEACVAGGLPVIKTMQNMCKVQSFRKVEGIFNGTSNYVLSRMREAGLSYTAALKEAREMGYAEADPYNDVSGQDAFCKLMIVSELAFGRQPAWEEVPVVGLDSIGEEAFAEATAKGRRFRQVGSVELAKDAAGKEVLVASVRPVAVDAGHPLYTIDGADNSVAIHTHYLGCITITGSGAGMYPTASVMVEDYMASVPPVPSPLQ